MYYRGKTRFSSSVGCKLFFKVLANLFGMFCDCVAQMTLHYVASAHTPSRSVERIFNSLHGAGGALALPHLAYR